MLGWGHNSVLNLNTYRLNNTIKRIKPFHTEKKPYHFTCRDTGVGQWAVNLSSPKLSRKYGGRGHWVVNYTGTQSFITTLSYLSSNFVYHHWGCTFIYRPFSLRSLLKEEN